jgi:mannose-1-phosphate guanylyltransferase
MAAIGLAAAILAQRDPDAVIGSFAADHMTSSTDSFLGAISEAVQVAHKSYLVTIGIAPSHLSTGFGYVRLGDKLGIAEAPNARLVSSFKENPNARMATAYIAIGSYRWNAGMVVTKVSFSLELLREYKPELEEALTRVAAVWDDEASRNKILEVWLGLEKIAIDHAVAEPAALEGCVAVVPETFGMSVFSTAAQN